MDRNKIVDAWIALNQDKFDALQLSQIRDKLNTVDESKLSYLNSIELKNPTTILVLAILLGGVDRILLDEIGMGILKMLTLGGFGIWWIIDMVNAKKRTQAYNFKKLMLAISL